MQGQSQQGQNPNQALEDFGYSLAAFLFGLGAGYVSAKVGKPALGINEGECGISIIIPTKNEGKRIHYLLESIKSQTFNEYEVILVDAHSNDGTREVCEKYGVKFIGEEGYQAHAQNVGARAAKYKHLLFMDADAIMPDRYWLYNVMRYTHLNGVIHGNFHTRCYDDTKLPDITYDPFMAEAGYPIQRLNIYLNIIDYCYCVYIDRDVFFDAGGFNDKLVIAQGSEFIDKCPIKPTILPVDLFIYTSDRRFRSKGMFQTVVELIKGNICAKLGIPISTDYWQPSVGIGPPMMGMHYRSREGELHAVQQGDNVYIHKDKVNPHKDLVGHFFEDVVKG